MSETRVDATRLSQYFLFIEASPFAVVIMKKFILAILNIVLLAIIWVSDSNYLDILKSRMDERSIVLTKDVILESGKEIEWVIPFQDKRDMAELLDLDVVTPRVGNNDKNEFRINVEGYIKFEHGEYLPRLFVPSRFGQNDKYQFTQSYVEPNVIDSNSSEKINYDNKSHYTAGSIVNYFWEPLIIRMKIVNVSDKFTGKHVQLTLKSKGNSEEGLVCSYSKFAAYFKIFTGLLCLLIIDFFYLKDKKSET